MTAGEISVLAEEVIFDRYHIAEDDRLKLHRRIHAIDSIMQQKAKPAEPHGSTH